MCPQPEVDVDALVLGIFADALHEFSTGIGRGMHPAERPQEFDRATVEDLHTRFDALDDARSEGAFLLRRSM